LILGSVATALQHVKSGRLRALAVTTPKRIAAAPDVPTVGESGYPSYEVTNWHGLVGPRGLSKDIVERLNKEANESVKSKDAEKSPGGRRPRARRGIRRGNFAVIIKNEVARWSQGREAGRGQGGIAARVPSAGTDGDPLPVDTLTHALSGALLARATAPKHAPPHSLPRRVAAGFFGLRRPDLDFVVSFVGPVEYLANHRGVTHSLISPAAVGAAVTPGCSRKSCVSRSAGARSTV